MHFTVTELADPFKSNGMMDMSHVRFCISVVLHAAGQHDTQLESCQRQPRYIECVNDVCVCV